MSDTGPSVCPPRSGTSKIRVVAIQTGRVRVKRAQLEPTRRGFLRILGPMIESEWAEWVPTFAWLIDHPEGPIVVDTGAAAHLRRLPRWHPFFQLAVRFDIESEQELGPQLTAIGLRSNDISKVILTHMHIDHDAGLHHVIGAPIIASAGEIAAAAGIHGRLMGYLPGRWPKDFDPTPITWVDGAVGPFRTSAMLTRAGDVFVVPTPGHTDHHVSVIVMDGDTAIFLAGDAAYTEAQMLEGRVDGVGWNTVVARDTLTRIRTFTSQTPTVFLPTHDPFSSLRLSARQTVPTG